MFIKKVVLLAIFVLPLAACDSRKPEVDASSYTSQSEILDMQEEEFRDEQNKNPDAVAPENQAIDDDKALTDEKQEEEVMEKDQKEESFGKDSETIDNTSSEADDTIY